MFRSSLLMVSVFVAGGYVHGASTVKLSTPMHHHTPDVREVLSVTGALAARSTFGGTAPERVTEQLAALRGVVDENAAWAAG